MRIRLSGTSLIGFLFAAAVLVLLNLLLIDNPQFIAWAKASGLTMAIPRTVSVNPFSNHMAFTVTGRNANPTLRKSFYAQAGSTIKINYNVQFDNQYAPSVTLYKSAFDRPTLWHATIKRSPGGVTITAPNTGYYALVVYPWGYNGDFDIWWEVK